MTVEPRLISPDTITLRAPMALRLRDVSDLSLVRDDLLVTATETSHAQRSFAMFVTPSGTWTASIVPGVPPTEAANPARWPVVAQPFELQVSDHRRRYLPLRMIADLPTESTIAWPGFASLPADVRAALLPAGSPPGYQPDFVPLFPGNAHLASGRLAEVRAHLAIVRAGVPAGNASFAVMTVSFAGVVRGVGVANSEGAILVSFPYPLLPTPTPAERVAGIANYEWPVSIAVYWGQLPAGVNGAPPLLPDILDQLNRTPSQVLERLGSTTTLSEQTLRVGTPLVLRSARAAPARPSSLFITAP